MWVQTSQALGSKTTHVLSQEDQLRCVDTLSRGSDILRVVRRPVVPLLCQALELVGIEVALALRYGRSDHIEGALRGSYGLLEHQVSFQPKPVWLCVLVE
jgi:hypothetical protein